MKRILLFGLCYFCCQCLWSSRINCTINEMWRFCLTEEENLYKKSFDDSNWEIVSIPHTWNAKDAADDIPGYFRGTGWYRRNLYIGSEAAGKSVIINFEGANQVVDLYVNGIFVGKHVGGYTRFNFDITPYIKVDQFNLLAIKVNNAHDADIPPLSADFTFFGGIYRDISLEMVSPIRFSITEYASSGVYIRTPVVTEEEVEVEIEAKVDNLTLKGGNFKLEYCFYTPNGSTAFKYTDKVKLPADSKEIRVVKKIKIENPELWSTEAPNLYKVRMRILSNSDGHVADEVVTNFGLRWYAFDADKGFFLNGKHVKLIGTNRHQCYDGLGNALRDEMHVRDVMLLKEMGGNFLRVSHYPQDPLVLDMCDKLGILTSVEIPIVNGISESEAFAQNSLMMAKEMVKQNFNHPSVVIWAYMNEVMLKPVAKSDTIRYRQYCSEVHRQAFMIENLIRSEDPHRYTMIPFHGSISAYTDAGLFTVPQIIGWNLYQGWYGGGFAGFDKFMDLYHERYPDKPTIITEYGADVDPRLHSFQPQRFDYTSEYANLFHEHYLKSIFARDFIAGAAIWNLNDFYSESRVNAVPHVNNKGITSLKRESKDTYLLYKVTLCQEPLIEIGSKFWWNRGGVSDVQGKCIQPLKIYSNLEKLKVKVNGEFIGEVTTIDKVANVQIPFSDGTNLIEVTGESDGQMIKDYYECDFKMLPRTLTSGQDIPFKEMNIMLGSKRYFEDKIANILWIPEQAYVPGQWGYIGGNAFNVVTRHGNLPASELNILGTDQDPIFQTQREGISAFKLDVPNGKYAIYLYLADLSPVVKREALAYNLGNNVLYENTSERVFNIKVNGSYQIKDLNIAEQIAGERAIIKKLLIDVTENNGITIDFEKVKGKPILNAIRVLKYD